MSIFDDLRLFILIAEVGSFTEAARVAKLTPGMASTHIAELERYFGVKVFFRNSRRIFLTSEGKLLFDKAKDLLKLASDAVRHAEGDSREVSGHVSICTTAVLANKILAPTIQRIWTGQPDVHMVLLPPKGLTGPRGLSG